MSIIMSEDHTLSVFIDANVLLDIYDETRVFHTDSLKSITALAERYDVVLFTSCDIITTLYYVLAKNNKAHALEMILDISELCDIVEFSNKEVLKSCEMMMLENSPYKDLEDTIQFVLAQKARCKLILSNDKKFVSPTVELLTTKKYASKLSKL